MAKKKSKVEEKKSEKRLLKAKKDFKIVHNDYNRDIKVGDVLDDVPEVYWVNLKTEGVI